jgi:hypothetical protein
MWIWIWSAMELTAKIALGSLFWLIALALIGAIFYIIIDIGN